MPLENAKLHNQRIKFKTSKLRPYKKKILVLRHRRALKIPPDETFLSWEGKKIATAARPPDFSC